MLEHTAIYQRDEELTSHAHTPSLRSSHRPKKAISAFFHYLSDPEIRSAAKEEHGVKGAKLTSVIIAQWKELDEEEKEPWIVKSEEEKAELEKNPVMVARKHDAVA